MSSAAQELAALAVINGLDPDQVFGAEVVENEVLEPSVAENLSNYGEEAYESCGERKSVQSEVEEMEEEKMEEEKEDENENECYLSKGVEAVRLARRLHCGHGFVAMVRREELQFGYVLMIVASILARTEARAEPELTWEELADHPELSRMIEGQRETTRLMFDSIPRICKQMDRRKRPMLALFAGSGKAKYREEIAHIGDHLLESVVRAPHLLDGLNVQKKRVVQRYLTACKKSPRTANKGKVTGALMGKEKRRLIFSTLSLSEQIGGLLSEFEIIILDEAGQASSAQVLSMLTNFPALKKLLVTGDDHQLGVNLQEVPEAVRENRGQNGVVRQFPEPSTITEWIEEAGYAPHGLRLVSEHREDRRYVERVGQFVNHEDSGASRAEVKGAVGTAKA
uniref:AAA_11 domain-containing protein n=1 Tax=Globodera pallida TaxID=36090 RepID=A0A183C9U0_GLOPA